MPQKPFTTIRVYENDRSVLLKRFGEPTHKALEKALNETCSHPEKSREYVTANLPMPDQEVLMEGAPRRTVMGGFYCRECGQYVFPKPQTEPVGY